ESGIYDVALTMPADHELATTGTVVRTTSLPEARKKVDIRAHGVREFTFLCSARYRCYEGVAKAGAPGAAAVRVHILALPEHDHYAKQILRIAIEALEKYARCFGPYPWADFTIAEAFFGWNGNECSTLVMIDERVFAMPHLACNYVEYLVSHEVSHQWWYN